MQAQDRRSGSRSWVPGVLATFWVLLAGISGAYLFYVITNPDAQRVERAMASPVQAEGDGGPEALGARLSPEEAVALTDAIEAKDQEIAALKSELRHLSGQVAAFDGRLKPIEKVLGPVAALPSSAAVTTSPPLTAPEATPAATPVEPPKPEAKQVPPEAPPAPAPPRQAKAAPEKPVDTKPAPPPPEQAEAEPKQPPPALPKPAASPSEQTVAALEPDSPPTPTQKPTGRSAPPAAPVAETDAEPAEQEPASEEPAAADQEEQSAEPEPAAPDETAAGTPAPSGDNAEVAALTAPNIPPGTTRFGIELGSVDKQDGIRPLWRNLLTNHAALVAGLQARRIIAPDKKWRLIAGPFSSAAEATQACTLFKKAEMSCEATVFAGDAL